MKKVLLALCFLACASLRAENYQFGSEIEKAYEKLVADNSATNQKTFFEAFPHSWSEYRKIEHDVHSWVDAFGKLTVIGDTAYSIRLLNLSIGADIDADNPNYLHSLLHIKMGCAACGVQDSHLAEIMVYLLTKISKGDKLRFWEFYWSSPMHEEDGGGADCTHEAELKRWDKLMSGKYPEEKKAMHTAYEYFAGGVWFISDYPYGDDWFSFGNSGGEGNKKQ